MAPVVGITSYVEQARWGVWDVPACVLPFRYVERVEEAGGRAVVLPPTAAADDTVLDRLAKKNLVTRERDGRAWRYRPADTREALTARTMRRTLVDMDVTDIKALHVEVKKRMDAVLDFEAWSRRQLDIVERALVQEQAAGNLREAIQLYKRAASEAGADRVEGTLCLTATSGQRRRFRLPE